MVTDDEQALRSELEGLNPPDKQAPQLKRIAAIGAHSIDFNRQAFDRDILVVSQGVRHVAHSGIPVSPNFEVSCFALPDRDFLRTKDNFDMAFLLYIPGNANGCVEYEPNLHDELPRDDSRWNFIVTMGHNPDNWQCALRRAGVALIAAYYGKENELSAADFTQREVRSSAPPYTPVKGEALSIANGYLDFCVDASYLHRFHPYPR